MSRDTQAGFGSRVALRTFLLFCGCAALPIVFFATYGFDTVSRALTESANQSLAHSAKNYGLLLFERLNQSEAALDRLASLALDGGQAFESVAGYSDRSLKIVSLREVASSQASNPSDAVRADGTLEVGAQEPIRMAITASRSGRAIRLVAELDPGIFWDDDSVRPLDGTLCVAASQSVLHCPNSSESRDTLNRTWELPLRPKFGVASWTITATQPRAVALSALESFRTVLPAVAGIVLAAAMLLSSLEIRRSHQPLKELTRFASTIGRRGTRLKRLRIKGKSEFSSLGRAFNRMKSRLERQLAALSAFSHIDRQILADPAVEPVVRATLPRAIRMMRARAVAIALTDSAGGGTLVFTTTTADPGAICSHRIDAIPATIQDSVSARDALTMSLPRTQGPTVTSWYAQPIEVGKIRRGLFLVALPKASQSRSLQSLAAGIARRVAVALGNEDRERALIHRAYFDSLTGLANRQLFLDRLDQELKSARRLNTSGAVFFIDLDRFKNVNDSLGHSLGDALLCAVADLFRAEIRESDTLARIGGDEFTVIAPGVQADRAHAFGTKLLRALDAPITLTSGSYSIHASIGVALYPQDGLDGEELMRNADTAMYRAKSLGRGRLAFFESAMSAASQRRLAVEQRLRHALRDDGLVLYYQPKVSAGSRRVVAFEALARWTDKELGPVSPGEFIPVAEDAGLIEELGRWAIRSACRDLSALRERGVNVQQIAVNVSMHQLADVEFASFVLDALRRESLAPCDIELEITESALSSDLKSALLSLQRLRTAGVSIAMDDFGTGYSSMSLLEHLPIDTVKIDQSFVARCATDDRSAKLVRALVGVAQALGKHVVAEGVETEAQAHYLSELGCELLQGYLFGKPQAAETIASDALATTDIHRRAAARWNIPLG